MKRIKEKLEEKIQEKVEEIQEQPMSDLDLKFYLPNTKVIKYSELSRYPTIESLLPKYIDAVMILYEQTKNNGHWVALTRQPLNKNDNDNQNNKSVYTYMDSYGKNIDNPLTWNTQEQNAAVGQYKPYLSELLRGKNVKYNKIQFQKETQKDKEINCCGRFATLFIMSVLDKRMYLKDFQIMLKKLKDHYKKSYDEVISFLIVK